MTKKLAENCLGIDLDNDGIYLIINKNKHTEKIDINDVISFVEDCEVQDVDFSAIKKALENKELYNKVKISSNKNISQKNESVTVQISKNNMNASIIFSKPGFRGELKTLEQIVKDIGFAGVKFGINEDMVKNALKEKEYGKEYIVAEGVEAADGADGYLEFKFDTGKKLSKPKILEDGRVDFHDLDTFESAGIGQELIVMHPIKQGVNGTNVLGHEQHCKELKMASKIVMGKNVQLKDGRYIATAGGQIIYNGKRILISPIMEIDGDVCTATGNINFKGSVLVKGNVMTGFSVIAEDVIEISGYVEGAYLKSNAGIAIHGGVHGLDKAVIISGGDISAKFVENCTISSDADVYARNILHSNVNCNGSVILEDKRAMIAGGKISVGKSVRAKTIGSAMATLTEINIGNPPKVLEKYEQMKAQNTVLKIEYDKIANICESLLVLNKQNQLGADKKELLLKAMQSKSILRDKINNLRIEMNETVLPFLGANKGALYASEVVRPGVRVLIGNAILHVKDNIYACRMTNEEGKIAINSYTGE